MKTLIFIQTNDFKVYYKCDTFWSTSTKIPLAKVYSDNSISGVNDLIMPYEYSIKMYLQKNPDKLDSIKERYNNCKMGYRDFDESLLKDRFRIREDVIDSDLGDLNFTHEIIINDSNESRIIDIRRDQKIKNILNDDVDN
jgi:hypothetical protein